MKLLVIALSIGFAGVMTASGWAEMPMSPSKPYAPTTTAPVPSKPAPSSDASSIEPPSKSSAAAASEPTTTAAEPEKAADPTQAKPATQAPKQASQGRVSRDHMARLLNQRELGHVRHYGSAAYYRPYYGAYAGQYGPNPYSSQGN